MIDINDIEEKFGSVEYKGEKYILIQDAYLSNKDAYGDAAYFANAVKAGDTADDGYVPVYVPVYTVEWKIIHPEAENEEDACDWDSPADVRDDGVVLDTEDDYTF